MFLGILGFIEGLIFSFFTFEMLRECSDIIDTNQTYVDEMQGRYGRPMMPRKCMLKWLGEDKLYWLFPTRPVIHLNYME